MLRMDGFTYAQAQSPEDAVRQWAATPDAMYIAGGTDLLPNLKHRIFRPKALIGIADALPRGWRQEGDAVRIGAGTRLSALSALAALPLLQQAAGQVAGPQIRNMGTLGGNVLLDTRCLFYNQTEFWRKSLGYCLKAEGTWCHVVGGPKTCVATQSSDTVPALMALGARLHLLGPSGPREIALTDLFRFNGMDHLKIQPGELLVEIVVPLPPADLRAAYRKVRTRDSIDFPQLSLAVAGRFEGRGAGAVAHTLTVVVGAINPQPKEIAGVDAFCGQPLTDERIRELGALVQQKVRPQGSVHGDTGWRRLMARVELERALSALRDADAA